MTQPIIPQLKSKYIPVFTAGFAIKDDISWWKTTAPFIYKNVLINLDTIEQKDISLLKFPEDMFLLTDSGGFQVISGQTDLTWQTSLIRQIELNASKIFSFDTPPVERVVEGQNIFRGKQIDEYKQTIEDNLNIAIEQSKWLQLNCSEKVKDFCYILHANSKEMLDYNIQLIDRKLGGMDNYKKYFGGICYAIKKSDYIFFTTCAAHAKKYFIDNGIYVHFLGIGSFNKMIILVYYEITTFDSSNALRGAISWSLNSPFDLQIFSLNKIEYPFIKQFCTCPVCDKINYNQLINSPQDTIIGRWFTVHNLWQILKLNIFLDSIDKPKYTESIRKFMKINEDITNSLNYIDDIDKMGLDIAYSKWKHFLKKDESKQNALF